MGWASDPLSMVVVAVGTALVLDLIPSFAVSPVWMFVNAFLAYQVYLLLQRRAAQAGGLELLGVPPAATCLTSTRAVCAARNCKSLVSETDVHVSILYATQNIQRNADTGR